MLRPELVCQLAYQFTDLQDTESGSVAVDGVILKSLGAVAESLHCLLNLLTVGNDMFQHADIAVKRLHTTVPRHHEWNPKSVGQDWW